jgi:hypothetical protein
MTSSLSRGQEDRSAKHVLHAAYPKPRCQPVASSKDPLRAQVNPRHRAGCAERAVKRGLLQIERGIILPVAWKCWVVERRGSGLRSQRVVKRGLLQTERGMTLPVMWNCWVAERRGSGQRSHYRPSPRSAGQCLRWTCAAYAVSACPDSIRHVQVGAAAINGRRDRELHGGGRRRVEEHRLRTRAGRGSPCRYRGWRTWITAICRLLAMS